MVFFGNLFQKNDGVDKNFINIVTARENGEEWAQEKIREMWNNGEPDLFGRINRAFVYIYEDAARRGNREAILKYARGLAYSNRDAEALQWYMSLINRNDTEAMRELAADYSEFGGLGENKAEQNKWIRRAAELGDSEAMVSLALNLAAAGDRRQSEYWYQQSAKLGNPDGKYGYAEKLKLDLAVINRLLNGIREDACAEIYSQYRVSSREECVETVKNLYFTVEELYIDVLNDSRKETSVKGAYKSLSLHYLYPPKGIFEPMPYRAAYFKYKEYYIFEEDYDFEELKKIVGEYNLKITNRTLDEWQDMPFEEWARQNGIDE